MEKKIDESLEANTGRTAAGPLRMSRILSSLAPKKVDHGVSVGEKAGAFTMAAEQARSSVEREP